jgi:hypothetical protein
MRNTYFKGIRGFSLFCSSFFAFHCKLMQNEKWLGLHQMVINVLLLAFINFSYSQYLLIRRDVCFSCVMGIFKYMLVALPELLMLFNNGDGYISCFSVLIVNLLLKMVSAIASTVASSEKE